MKYRNSFFNFNNEYVFAGNLLKLHAARVINAVEGS